MEIKMSEEKKLVRKPVGIKQSIYKSLSILAIKADKRLCEYLDDVLTLHIELHSEDK